MLKSPDLYSKLKTDGFVLLDANIAHEASELDHYISSNFELPESGFYYSLLNNKFPN
jgi:hypothetical protein